MFKSVTFEVTGEQRLNCGKCEQRVARLVGGLQGVRQVRAQAQNQRVDVLFNTEQLEESAIAACLREAGYETQVIR